MVAGAAGWCRRTSGVLDFVAAAVQLLLSWRRLAARWMHAKDVRRDGLGSDEVGRGEAREILRGERHPPRQRDAREPAGRSNHAGRLLGDTSPKARHTRRRVARGELQRDAAVLALAGSTVVVPDKELDLRECD